MKPFLLAALLVLTLGGHAEPPPQGTLIIVGGGATPGGLHRKLLDLAGGPGARVLVVPLGQAPSPESKTNPSVSAFREAGGTQVSQISADDPKAALAEVKAAEVIWFPGGKQSLMMESLQRLGVVEAIRERHAQGAVLGGTSAGAAIMSKVMIAGTDSTQDGGMTPMLGEGLGLWPGVIVDQHFVKRGREPRLRAAVQAHPELLGVGIDESTFVLVKGNSFETGDKSTVLVLDSRQGGPMKRTELKAGDTFELVRP